MSWCLKKGRIKSSCYVIICCLFWNLVTIIIAFVSVHVYTLKFWDKITFYHFSKKCLFSVFLHIEAQLSLKNARLPPVFFLDFNSPWYDLLVSDSHTWEKKLPISTVGAVLKSGNCLSSLDISLVVTLGPEYIVTHFKFEFFPCSLIMLCYYNLVWTNEIYLFFKLTWVSWALLVFSCWFDDLITAQNRK